MNIATRLYRQPFIPIAAGALFAPPALAHHAMGGEAPASFMDGLLSGLGHPLIGADHALFLIAIGLFAALRPRVWPLPLVFTAAAAAGVAGHLWLGALPAAALPALMLVLFAGLMALAPQARDALLLPLAMAAGLVHGYAYGEAIVGAEATPIAAYLVGLTLIQMAVVIAIALCVRPLLQRPPALAPVRLAGVALFGCGLLVMV